MSDLVKKEGPPSSTGISISKGKLKSSTASPFQQRVAQAKASTPDAATMPNRLCLMLDRSSSMSQLADFRTLNGRHTKIELLKQAIDNFVGRCDFSNTSIAVETFPEQLSLDLTSVGVMVTSSVAGMSPSGNTPMRRCITNCLNKVPMTRGILVSDGEATDWRDTSFDHEYGEEVPSGHDSILARYKAAGIPIDTVHIGDSTQGEELLRRIAKETGGIYLKFTDVGAFATAFAYLTPGYRAMLTDGRVDAATLGAKEVSR